MSDFFGAVAWTDFSTGGLLALAIVLIIRGDLIPRKTHEAMVADRDEWKALAQTQQLINAELAESVKTSAWTLSAIPSREEATRGRNDS